MSIREYEGPPRAGMVSSYAVIVSDEAGERCEGLHGTIREALDRVRSVIAADLATEGWVVTLIPATQAFTKEQDGQLFKLESGL